ncbi:hypothetical protein FQN54_002519 [Arachnomyces sp. PD_36]|nr:hypothetical protein FQN54_002519 [Arachnomyces sp. PD_36]
MFLKSFLALAVLLALVQFSVAVHAEKPGVSPVRRPTLPLAKRSLGKPITSKVKHTNLSMPAVRRNLVAEAKKINSRDTETCEEEDYGLCDESGECCPMDTGCCEDGNCAKDGETCCDEGGICGEGEQCCEDGCIDSAEICCGDYSCDAEHLCCGDGDCAPFGAECCMGGGYCDEGFKCMEWQQGDDEGKMVCCDDENCDGADSPDDLPTPKGGAANRVGGSDRLWNLAGSMAVPVVAAAWL